KKPPVPVMSTEGRSQVSGRSRSDPGVILGHPHGARPLYPLPRRTLCTSGILTDGNRSRLLKGVPDAGSSSCPAHGSKDDRRTSPPRASPSADDGRTGQPGYGGPASSPSGRSGDTGPAGPAVVPASQSRRNFRCIPLETAHEVRGTVPSSHPWARPHNIRG